MKNFVSQIYTNLDVSVPDFMSEKYYRVHNMLYFDALKKCMDDLGFSDETHSFDEVISSKNYYDPSHVIVTERDYPFMSKTIDLTKYWSDYKFNETEVIELNYNVDSKNYINGTYKMSSKFFDRNKYEAFNSIVEGEK